MNIKRLDGKPVGIRTARRGSPFQCLHALAAVGKSLPIINNIHLVCTRDETIRRCWRVLTVIGNGRRVAAAWRPKMAGPAYFLGGSYEKGNDAVKSDSVNGSEKTVLVVEDNELNMKLFHDLLEAHGYHILQTKDGLEALRLAREHRPDLILMDIQLPEVSGLEVTKWIKEDDNLKSIPVVAVTAFAMKGDEEKIREGGCEAYISKPISVTHFLQTVQRFLS